MNKLITTAISYTNGSPHIGHLYESVLADFIKNLNIINGYNTKLLTGTDEHGKKIEETSIKNNMSPKELCDKYSNEFKLLNNRLHTKYDHFIRTTDLYHKELVQTCLIKVKVSNDIYVDSYTGYYNVREEAFVSELDCKQTNYKDPVTGKPYELVKESTYYFRLTKYKEKIIEYLNKLNVMDYVKDELIQKVQSDDFCDLSISRTSFKWGIEFPFDSKHIVYVWFDALLNYISGRIILFDGSDVSTTHIIGKDIVWFHAVIYPAILYALGWEKYITPNIFIHGFIMDKNGVKMSKSLGNVIDCNYILDKYNLESIRYYLISNTSIGEDINFSEDQLVAQYNNELIKSFGNLFQRLYKLLLPNQERINLLLKNKYDIIKFNYNLYRETIEDNINIKKYMRNINDKLNYLNKWIQDSMPWKKDEDEKIILLTDMLIQLDLILILMFPIIPDKINELRGYLGLEQINKNVLNYYDLQIKILDNNIKVFNMIK